MLVLWSTLAGYALWLELVYHLSGFGLTAMNPAYTLMLIVTWSGIWTLFIGLLRGIPKKILLYLVMWVPAVWTGAQLVYLRIFKQPLLLEAIIQDGQDALGNYWREALDGILRASPFLLLLLLPAVVLPILLQKGGRKLPVFDTPEILWSLGLILLGAAGSIVVLKVGQVADFDYYEEYSEFYDPLTVAEDMGVLPTFYGDLSIRLRMLLYDALPQNAPEPYVPAVAADVVVREEPSPLPSQPPVTQDSVSGGDAVAADPTQSSEEEIPQEPVIRPQQFALDYDLLHQLADNEHQKWLADYIQGQEPVDTNEYTGMFEGYNLIFLTAEGFSSCAIDKELTPTLYMLSNSGFVCENYYVPLWQTSTSDGEYINMTGLIPDRQHSMSKSAANVQPYALPAFFAAQGAHSYAYHNNSLSYYDRHKSHPNMGYDFKACKLGGLKEAEWGDKVFVMENAGSWPASDLDMMIATVPEYVNEDRFHVYYMTVSGHMNYSFKANAMSAKNKDLVADLGMTEEARAYIACNIELDRAMENLLAQLKEAGQLENTVICLSADHYPYAMERSVYEELAGHSLSAGKDLFRNTLILWNAAMEEPVYIDKACGSMDLLPTLLNLFGFEYDSRMYAGRDILSDREGMVIFNNRDFVTDSVIFIEKGDVTTWLQDDEGNDLVADDQKADYLAAARQEVRDRYNFSAYILEENYYADVLAAVIPTEQ